MLDNISNVIGLLALITVFVFLMNRDVTENLRDVRMIHSRRNAGDYSVTDRADHLDYHNLSLNPVHMCSNNPNKDVCNRSGMDCYNFVSGDNCHMKYDETGTEIDYPNCMAIKGNWKPYTTNEDGSDKYGCFANPTTFPPDKENKYEPHDARHKDRCIYTADVRPKLAYEKPMQ